MTLTMRLTNSGPQGPGGLALASLLLTLVVAARVLARMKQRNRTIEI
jgi:hypothetical protein